eukprot:CAMPEP_0197242002 /NCGR_PEP_ID=MMETSP1429-20130617/7866_1 /TAXON_ID=49237 /ORGANISM="Chaetoceros  sp., Strain UNC1202" /LENGTH=187 /DNA_ID=CAMNT_0042701927 /DNA_START=26 /DNA_END=589 /DNA_ORIENTATION=+
MKVFPSIRLKPKDTKDVKADEYAAVTEASGKEIEELKNNSDKMQAKMKENEVKYLKQVENVTSKMHKMEEYAKKLEKELKETKIVTEEHRNALNAMTHQQNCVSSSGGGLLGVIGGFTKSMELLKGKAENAEHAKKLEKELKEMKRAAEEHRTALNAMTHRQNHGTPSLGGFLADAIGGIMTTVFPF